MSLVTVLRSPSSESASWATDSEVDEDQEDSSCRSRASSFEGFFASKGAAYALPDGDFARRATKHGGEMQLHLQAMVNLLRDEDVLRLVVKLESQYPNKIRYLTVVSAFGPNDEEESIIMGVDWTDKATIGLVVPLYRDTTIRLDGDGGFKLISAEKSHDLKPVSVQTMWTALQWIHKCADNARRHNYYPTGLSHTWVSYYVTKITSDRLCLNEWNQMDDLWSKRKELPLDISPEKELIMKLIRHKLREVMLKVDLEEVTSRQVRNMLEEDTQMELKEYREFVDEEMMTILGQMDSASKIFDHVFLGSEWNASNLEELKENGVGFILNITREIDNFFPGTFSYYNIRVWDMDETELLHHWDNTYKFIQKAKDAGSKVLVHCKMGISRSASTVIAYGMKEYGWSLGDTMKYVKARRSCVQPNAGFWKQLITYEGILNSSKQRYNKLFSDRRAQSDSSDAEKRSKRVKKTAKKTKKKYNTIGYSPAGASEQTKSEPVQSEGVDAVDIGTDSESVPLKSESSSEGSEGESEEDRVASEDDGDDVFFPEAVSGDKREPEVVPSTSTPYVAHTAPLVEETEEASEEAVESLSPVSGIRSAEKSSLYRVSSVPTLVSGGHTRTQQELALKDPGNFRRTSSLRERGRIKADGLRSLTAGKSASAENIRECSAEDKGIVQSEEARICADAPGTAAEKNVQGSGNEAEIPSAEEIVLETESAETESAGEEISDGGIKTETVEHLNLASSLPRDLLGVMESGFVKRHSRNFEEGIFNLPLQIEPIDDGVGLTEEESEVDVLPPAGDNKPEPEVESSPGEEPEPGVVKKHKEGFEMKHRETMKKQLSLQRSSSGEGGGRGGVEGGLDTPLVPGLGDGEDLFQAKDSETLAADPGLQRELEDVDSVSVSVEALIQKVNEDMKKEVSSRRTSQSKKEQEVRALVDKAVGQMEESVAEVGDEDSTEDGNGEGVTLRRRNNESESPEVPVVGLVKRNTLILEGKARDLLLQDVQPGEPVMSKGEATGAVLIEKEKVESSVEQGMNTAVEPSGVEIDQGPAESEEASKSSEEKEDKESEQDTENIPQKGLVKRHTLLIEERLQPLEQEENKAEKEEDETGVEGTSEKTCVSGEDGGPRYQIELTCDDREEVTVAVEEDPEALAGLVKREKLRIEERLQPVVVDSKLQEVLASDDVAGLEADVLVEEGGRQELKEASQEDKDGTESQDDKETEVGVDTSSVVKVKEHAQHLECVLREGLTTESKGVKRQKSSEEETRADDAAPKVVIIPRSLSMERADEGNDCTTAGTHAHTDDTMESLSDSAVSLALQKAQDNLDPEQEKPDNWEAGNVKQRTQILEEIIRDRDEDGEKKGNSVRRHESMPKTIRPPEKFVLRRRSVSDITENNSGGSRRDVVYTVQRIKDCSAESTSSSSLPRDWSPLQDKPEETNTEKEKLKADEFPPEIYCEGEVKDKTHIQLFECLDNSRESSLSVKEKIQIYRFQES